MGVWTKKWSSMKAVVLMATPCPKSLHGKGEKWIARNIYTAMCVLLKRLATADLKIWVHPQKKTFRKKKVERQTSSVAWPAGSS